MTTSLILNLTLLAVLVCGCAVSLWKREHLWLLSFIAAVLIHVNALLSPA